MRYKVKFDKKIQLIRIILTYIDHEDLIHDIINNLNIANINK